MATPVNMPQVGQDLETARIIEWHVKEGDRVMEGDIIATVESDKASFEVESFAEGTVLKLLFEEGEDGYVFKPIAYIGVPGESIATEDSAEQKVVPPVHVHPSGHDIALHTVEGSKKFSSPSARRIAREKHIDLSKVIPTGPNGRIIKKDVLAYAESSGRLLKATPLARNIANQEGVDLSSVKGTGHLGRIQKSDVMNTGRRVSRPVPVFEGDEVIQFDKVRKIIADRLTESKQTIPHYFLKIEADVTNLLHLKSKLTKEIGVKVSLNDLLILAVSRVLPRFRLLNAHVDQEKMVLKKDLNFGIAVTTDKGLFVPVLCGVEKMTLADIAAGIRKLAEDARRGVINSSVQGTFTISNLGMYGISEFQAIINPPECAILSVGGVGRKVVPTDDGMKIIDVLSIGMAIDHRAVDGAYGAQFLAALKQELFTMN